MAASISFSSYTVCSPATIVYTCDATQTGEHFFHITIQSPNDGQSTLDFQMPAWNALYQIRDFAHRVRRVKAVNPAGAALPVEKIDKQTWRVFTQGAAEATLTYEVFANDLSPFDSQLDPHHAFINPALIFMYPVGKKSLPLEVKFRVPDNWRIATELVPTPNSHDFSANNYDHLADTPIEIGTFRRYQFEVKGAQIAVVVDSDTVVLEEKDLLELLKRIIAAEFELMQDVPLTHYTFIYHFPSGPASGGMEHAFSTAINVSAPQVTQRLNSIAGVSAHEFFHLWNVKRIRPASLEPIDYTKENPSRALWFSEGFTSLYGAYILVRSGVQSKEEFYEGLARTIQSEQTRPAHLLQSAEESSLDTWYDKYAFYRRPENSISYYTKGEIIGLLLDLAIRKATDNHKSLDDLMRFLNVQYAKRGLFFDERTGVPDAVAQVVGKRFDEFFTQYVRGVHEIEYDKFLGMAGLKLTIQPRPVADLGFTVSQNFDGSPVVDETLKDGPAEKAGLKRGDELIEINGQVVSRNVVEQVASLKPETTLALKVRRRGGLYAIAYQSGSKIVPRYLIEEIPNCAPMQKLIREGILTGK